MNIRRKIFIPMITLTVVCCVAVLISSIVLYIREINTTMNEKVEVAINVVLSEIYDLSGRATIAAMATSRNTDLIEALVGGDRDEIIDVQTALLDVTMVDYSTVVTTDGTVIYRTHEPDIYSDNISDLPHIAAAMEERIDTFIMQGPVVTLGISAAAPIYDSEKNFVGIISIGYKLNNQDFVYRLKEITGCEISIFRSNERIATTVLNPDGTYALGLYADASISSYVLAGERFSGEFKLFGKNVLGIYSPLIGMDDNVVGMAFVGHYTAEDTNKILMFIISGVVITLLVLVVCIVLAQYISKAIEARLNKAQERAFLMLDTAPLCTQIFNRDLQTIDCNEEAVRLYNLKDKQEYIDGFLELCHPEFQPDGRRSDEKAKEMIEKAFDEGRVTFKWEHRMPADNTPIPAEITLVHALYDDEEVVIGYTKDLRERIQREAEMVLINNINELQLVKLNTVVKATKIALWDAEINTKDPLNPSTYVKWSDEFRSMIGFMDVEEFPNTFNSWISRLHPDDHEDTMTAFANHLLDSTGKTPFNVKYRLKKRNGEYSYYHAAGESIRNEEGEAVRVAGSLIDVTELMSLQSNLEHERSTLQTIFDTIPDLIFCRDKDFIFTRCNKSLLEFFNIKEEALIGQNDVGVLGIPKEMQDQYKIADITVVNEGKTIIAEELIPAHDGTIKHFETSKVPLLENGKVTGFLGIARDITERKAMEEATLSANRSKTVFLTNMSHEIRTPMNSIIGFSELAQSDNIPDATRKYLGNIQESAEWLLKIINDILDISKIESGKIELEHIPFDLPEIFSQCQASIMPKITEKGIMLYCYAEPSIGRRLLGDPMRLRQVIMNLLSNAVKFTNTGTVKFLASLSKRSEDNVTIQFEIKDSGIGMTAEQIEKIFNPFTQAEESISRRFGGTGLGLTITKNIVELMGGTLLVESALGVGSKFSFELTFDLVDETDSPHAEVVLNDFQKPHFSGDVLICEDNNLNQQVICDHLGRVGLQTFVAENGKEGLDLVSERIRNNEKPFDLIFMDIHMPIMDGLDAASRIIKLGVDTPIVALTANIMSNDIELYKSNGMLDTVGKPFTAQELWKCLAKYLTIDRYSDIDKNKTAVEDSKALLMIKSNFVANNQTTCDDIILAVDLGDIKLAHRLAHSLKTNAGQIGEKKLQLAAAKVEASLQSDDPQIDKAEFRDLRAELVAVLVKLAPLLREEADRHNISVTDTKRVHELLDKLEPLLKSKDTQCLKLIDELYSVKGSGALIEQLKGFKFKQAYSTLIDLRKELMSEDE